MNPESPGHGKTSTFPLLTAKSPYQEFERHCSNSLFRLSEIPTLPETKSLPLKIGIFQPETIVFQSIHFQLQTVSFREGHILQTLHVWNTSVGRKAPVEGLSHDLVCTGSIYHVHFAWQVWHGQLSPRFKFNKLKSFSGVEIDQNHVDKRILGGKGFAVGRLKRHNFCPASALRNRCCIDTKRCSGGYTQPQVVRLR